MKNLLFVFSCKRELIAFVRDYLDNLTPEQYDVTEEKVFSRYYVEVPRQYAHLIVGQI